MEYKSLGHLMLDLETIGNKSNSALLSIGAVEFDIKTGEIGRQFYERVDLQSCFNKGLFANGSTIYWWLQQNDAARKEVVKGGDNISNVLSRLHTFMLELGDFQLWGNSARFDVGILENAFTACHFDEMPWKFRNERDVRTLVSFAPSIKEQCPFQGIRHEPISDCIHQITYCSTIWNKLAK